MPDHASSGHTPPAAGLITEALLARPHITERAGELAFKRLEVEAYYRPHRTDRDETAPVTWLRGLMMDVLRLGLKCTGLFQRGLSNALDLRLVEHDFVYEGLPEDLSGFRILQLSDLHLPGRFPRFAETAANLLRGTEVDLCVLNGDYRWGYYGPADHVAGQLRHILSGVRSRFGTVACLGNHDILAIAELLEASGIPILFNEGAALHVGDAVLWVCAIDDPHVFRCDRLDLALRDAPPDAFIVLLVHTPERIAQAEKAGASLYLAGHTHGGQIRLPLLGALSKMPGVRGSSPWENGAREACRVTRPPASEPPMYPYVFAAPRKRPSSRSGAADIRRRPVRAPRAIQKWQCIIAER